MDGPCSDLDRLQVELASRGSEYLLLSPLPDSVADVRFIGRFDGRDVVWEMRLYTLDRYAIERGNAPAAPDVRPRGLMVIEPLAGQTMRVEVALRLPEIGEPAVRKTIVMLRNYRRLRPGLRTWGDAVEPAD